MTPDHADEPRPTGSGRVPVRLLLLIAGTALLVWLLLGFEWSQVLQRLRSADLVWLPVLTGILAVYVLLRSLRWWLLVGADGGRLRFLPLLGANAVGVALGNFSPMQAGELAKVELGARSSGIGRLELAALFLVERLLDTLVLAGLFAFGLATSFAGILRVDVQLLVVLLGLLLPALGVLWWANRRWPEPARRAFGAVLALRARPGRLLAATLLTCLSWACIVAAWIGCARCFGIELAVAPAMALIGAVTFLRVLTLIPGGVGVDEASIVGLMRLLEYPAEQAQAFALGSRVLDLLLLALAVVALPCLRHRPQEATT